MIYKQLYDIQQKLVVAKAQLNTFGKYNYRSAEDIIEAVKNVSDCAIVMSDELVLVGDRYYIKATVSIFNDKGETVASTAYAREDRERKGMSVDQLTGSCSSYARKYALNALFAIDDTKDADTLDNRHNLSKTKEERAEVEAIQASIDDLLNRTLQPLIELIEADDVSILELWEELTREEQTICHKALNSKQKSALKALLFKVRSEEDEP